METFQEALKYFITIISIINPIGAIPIFLTSTKIYSTEEIAKISTICAVTVVVTLAISTVLGDEILGFFGIQIASFRVGGGILIGLSALSMLKGEPAPIKMSQEEIDRQSQMQELSIVPLAIPLLAGPGTIVTCIIQAESFQTTTQWASAFFVMAVIGILIKLILTFSRKIRERLGRVTLNVMTRVSGIILMAVSIEHISRGVKQIFNL
ncbi:MAG: NAAT family transporter [Halobacteriovoraceae bacterium]|nr:NAAT family transporter [Halobacteriovoraceae bacterium]MCB9093646.1 NAAT family transporter [Halobacteriovoraceae bacterium]